MALLKLLVDVVRIAPTEEVELLEGEELLDKVEVPRKGRSPDPIEAMTTAMTIATASAPRTILLPDLGLPICESGCWAAISKHDRIGSSLINHRRSG